MIVEEVECDCCARRAAPELARRDGWTLGGVAGYYDFCSQCTAKAAAARAAEDASRP